MIIGLGTDIVEVGRIRGALSRWGDDFLARILVPAEIAYCEQHRDPAPHVAGRFAAKEALAKAFGTGIGADLSWHDLEIARDPAGRPLVLLHGGARPLLTRLGGSRVHLSLSHTQNHATATAILEG